MRCIRLLGDARSRAAGSPRYMRRTAADFDQWSWSNQVGAYQTYIYVSAIQHAIEKARLLTSDAGKLACESTLRPSSGLV